MQEVRERTDSATKKEEQPNLQTIYATLDEAEGIFRDNIDGLEFVANGPVPKDSDKATESDRSSISCEDLLRIANRLTVLANTQRKLINQFRFGN